MSQTAKVLLLYAHPESQDSVANRVLLEPALQLPNVTVHDLYAHYPDFFIDIAYEQDLLRQHEVIVFQHPLYTWSCPALLKEWLDRVLSRGFASGAGGNELAGKYWRSVITTGEPESAYRRDANRYPMNDILRPFDLTASPRQNEPDELAALLEMKGATIKDTAVSLMRPSAIREAAQLVTFQTAIAWRYKQLVTATEAHSAIMDTAFNFGPLLMTQGDALILPPVLTRAGASMRIESGETATAAQTSYELLAPARYVSVAPTWREFLMADAFPEPEKPNPAVMPKDDKERRIWREAVREAWSQGLAEADQLYADNISRMVRQYRGLMLYHLLTAQHLLSKVNTASAALGTKTTDSGNKLHIGQKVYRITAPSAFLPQAQHSGRK